MLGTGTILYYNINTHILIKFKLLIMTLVKFNIEIVVSGSFTLNRSDVKVIFNATEKEIVLIANVVV